MAKDSASPRTLLVSSVLVGLTPLIPVPLLDDAVKAYIERRMVRGIAAAHGVELDEHAVRALVDDVGGSTLRSIAMGVVTFPAKLIFRKLFVVLEVKRASDEASRAYHRGHLLDRALASGALVPQGRRSPSEIRAALDRATSDGRVSPISGLMRAVFQRSTDVLELAGKGLLGLLGKKRKADEETVGAAVEGAASTGPVGTMADRLEAALRELPSDHFKELESRFDHALANGRSPM